MKKLLNKNNIKTYINEQDLSVSKHFYEAIEEWFKYELDMMILRSKQNNRTTVMKRDI